MKYKEALQIGTQAEGTIQCTYATIYDANHRPLFSLQRKNFDKSDAYWEFMREYGDGSTPGRESNQTIAENFVYTADGQEGVILWDLHGRGQVDIDNAPTGIITFDVPLVVVDQYSEDQYIPCKLLYPTVEYLQRTIQSAKKVKKYTIYKLKDDGTLGDIVGIQYTKPKEEDLENGHCDYRVDPKALPKVWEDLLHAINSDDTLYVKPAAFNWQITQIRVNFVTDEEAKEKGAVATDPTSALGILDAARKKYEKAKAVLVAAGLTNFI